MVEENRQAGFPLPYDDDPLVIPFPARLDPAA
jgi:hypothetical protein